MLESQAMVSKKEMCKSFETVYTSISVSVLRSRSRIILVEP
jgi:hypothetical protein